MSTQSKSVSLIRFESGNDHVNKDDGRITFWTSEASRNLTERMRIDYNGVIGTTSDSVNMNLIWYILYKKNRWCYWYGDTDLFVA